MKVVQRKVWVTQLVCKKCGREETMWHGEERPTKEDYPTEGWNGWNLETEICGLCDREKAIRVGITM